VLLGALIVGDPGRIDRRSNPLRVLSIVLVCVLVFNSLWATSLAVLGLVIARAVNVFS
jgi:hypothetical protein